LPVVEAKRKTAGTGLEKSVTIGEAGSRSIPPNKQPSRLALKRKRQKARYFFLSFLTVKL
jgi:hypothetical protein